jgi:hypothetical protein
LFALLILSDCDPDLSSVLASVLELCQLPSANPSLASAAVAAATAAAAAAAADGAVALFDPVHRQLRLGTLRRWIIDEC